MSTGPNSFLPRRLRLTSTRSIPFYALGGRPRLEDKIEIIRDPKPSGKPASPPALPWEIEDHPPKSPPRREPKSQPRR